MMHALAKMCHMVVVHVFAGIQRLELEGRDDQSKVPVSKHGAPGPTNIVVLQNLDSTLIGFLHSRLLDRNGS